MPIILFLIFIFLGIFFYTWYELRSSLRPKRYSKKQKSSMSSGIIEKILTASDGKKISAWYIPVNNPKAVIILIHGYKEANEDKTRLLPHAEYLKKAGYSTILIDVRHFGESEGDKVSLGAKEWMDAETAFDYAKSLPANKNLKIGFYGKSMGGVTSIIAKGITGKGDFIIALTPYASFKNLFNFQLKKKRYPTFIFFPFLYLAALLELGFNFEKYSPINFIKKINVPIFIAGAKYDNMVPQKDAKYLFDNANNPKEFWEISTNHNDIYRENPEEFEKKILGFLSKYVK